MLEFMHFAGMQNLFKVCSVFSFVLLCVALRFYTSMRSLKILASSRLRSVLLLNASWTRRSIKYGLTVIGFASLMIALLQPQWNKKEEEILQQGHDILIAIDISRSMLCSDQKPNRLEYAKQKIRKILYNLKCERVGLILFSGEAVIQCPLTVDYSAFFMFLDNLDVETISVGTTSLDGAIKTALKIFEDMSDRKSKILCVFTDGEDFSADLAGIKERAAQQHLSIFTFGVGSQRGAPIPIFDGKNKNIGFEKDESGNIIMSKLNEPLLKNLSQQTGGKYIRVSQDTRDVQEFVGAVDSFEKDTLGSNKIERYQAQYWYFVAVSLLCFGLEWLL